MVTVAGLRPVLTTSHPHWDSDALDLAANGYQRVVWDPVSWIQAQTARRPDDFEFRLSEAQHIVDALAPWPDAVADDESKLSRLILRRYLVPLLVVASEIEADVARFNDWLEQPFQLQADAAHFTESLSSEALDHWQSAFAFGFNDNAVRSVLAVVQTHRNRGRPTLLPDTPTPVLAESTGCCEGSAGVLYLRAAACHLNLSGLPVRSISGFDA